MYRFFKLMPALLTVSVSLFAQDRDDKTAVTYEQIYDEPYAVNKLFVAFQPLYGEMFVTNVNGGFGFEAMYYYQDKADFRANFRKSYGRKFLDLSRDVALDNSQMDNRAQVYSYFELGGTYHLSDTESPSKTKMILYKKSYKGNRWASRVPLNAEVSAKVRKIYGLRAGGLMWASSTDLTRALAKQGLENSDLRDAEGNGLPMTYEEGNQQEALNVFTNLKSTSVYLGGSLAWFRNVAVSFDKFEEGIDDLLLTVYADLMYAPTLSVDDIVYTEPDAGSAVAGTRTYDVSPVRLQNFGGRIGIDGRFNRTFSWAYGAELGYRPSIEGRTFYALLKISFPVFGSNLDYQVESFEK